MLPRELPVDDLGTTRHIARDEKRHSLLDAPRDHRDWVWKCRVDALDTALFEHGSPMAWFFTSKHGHWVRKSDKNTSLDTIKREFSAFNSIYRNNPEQFAYIVHLHSAPKSVTEEELRNIFSTSAGDIKALQPYAVPRRPIPGFATFQHEYSLLGGSSDPTPVMRSFRYMYSSKGESGTASTVTSQDKTSNSKMDSTVLRVVRFLEASAGVRVVKMKTDFCLDENEKLWLVYVSSCATVTVAAKKKKKKRRSDADDEFSESKKSFGASNVQKRYGKKKGQGATFKQVKERLEAGLAPFDTNDENQLDESGKRLMERFGIINLRHGRSRLIDSSDMLTTDPFDSPSSPIRGRDRSPVRGRRRLGNSDGLQQQHSASVPDFDFLGRGGSDFPRSREGVRSVVTAARAGAAVGQPGDGLSSTMSAVLRHQPSSASADARRRPFSAEDAMGSGLDRGARSWAEGSSGGVGVKFSAPLDPAQETALRRMKTALQSLSISDMAELCTLLHPPPAVQLAVTALMLLVKGVKMTWTEARKAMGKGEKLMQQLVAFDPQLIPARRLREVLPIVSNPAFEPRSMRMVSRPAATLAEWIVATVEFAGAGMLAAQREKKAVEDASFLGYSDATRGDLGGGGSSFHPDSSGKWKPSKHIASTLSLDDSGSDVVLMNSDSMQSSRERLPSLQGSSPALPPMSSSSANVLSQSRASSSSRRKRPPTFAEKLEYRKALAESKRRNPSPEGAMKQRAPSPIKSGRGASKRSSALQQQAQMSRLSALPGQKPRGFDEEEGDDFGGGPGAEEEPHVFRMKDGVTSFPYIIIGRPDPTKRKFVVIPDLFDTYQSLQILLRRFSRRTGCQVIIMNLPGQAYTSYSSATSESNEQGHLSSSVLNNEFYAYCVSELLKHVDTSATFPMSEGLSYMVGFGNGANVACMWSLRYSKEWEEHLAGIVSLNGFAKVGASLAAALHASINVFSCLPEARPDLPVSYFSRYLFGDEYLRRISPGLALSIYTAVTNPITLDGRTRICRGALSHTDLSSAVRNINLPLIVVQSTEDALVAPESADHMLNGRTVRHVWSHEQSLKETATDPSKQQAAAAAAEAAVISAGVTGALPAGESSVLLGPRAVGNLAEVLSLRDGAMAIWMRTGHEIKQEAKVQLLQLFHVLADPLGENIPTTAEAPSPFALSPPGPSSRLRQGGSTKAAVANRRSEKDMTAGTSMLNSKRKLKGRHGVSLEPEDDLDRPAAVGHIADSKEESALEHKEETAEQRSKRLQEAEEAYEKAIARHADWTKKMSSTSWDAKVPGSTLQLDEKGQAISTHKEKQYERDAAMKLIHDNEGKAVDADQSSPDPNTTIGSLQASFAASSSRPEATKRYGPALRSGEDSGASFGVQGQAMSSTMPRESGHEFETEMEKRLRLLREEQEARRRRWEEEDRKRLEALREMSVKRAEERATKAAQLEKIMQRSEANALEAHRKAEEAAAERVPLPIATAPSVSSGGAEAVPASPIATGTPKAAKAEKPVLKPGQPIPKPTDSYKDPSEIFQEMEAEAQAMEKKRFSTMTPSEAKETESNLKERAEKLEQQQEEALKNRRVEETGFRDQEEVAVLIQSIIRGFLARQRTAQLSLLRQVHRMKEKAAVMLQAVYRGIKGRERAKDMKGQFMAKLMEDGAALTIQRVFRGHVGRKLVAAKKYDRYVIHMQRVVRGFLARCYVKTLYEELAFQDKMYDAAAKIQATYRMHRAIEQFRDLQILQLASIQIQRVWRGWLGRQRAARRKAWQSVEPGPERLKLGIKLIEGAKDAFERQRSEIEALHRAQERAESRVSAIHSGLKESEAEMATIQKELEGIDKLDRELRELAHDKAALERAIEEENVQAAAREVSSGKGRRDSMSLVERERQRREEQYALEMAIQVKQAERERKRQELEAEFNAVFEEVNKKRAELHRLEDGISEMESTRQRKEREFQRLQRNLTELLTEQKRELDALREKGVQLEQATATSAAAAAATASAAQENAQRSQAMFKSTEELLKFQFMSMSLSYFSSLNMLSSLRDMNHNTTTAAIGSSAKTAAAAAAASAAANIPRMNDVSLGPSDLLDASAKQRQLSEAQKRHEIEEAKKALEQPLPKDITRWRVYDVLRWLDSLSLPQYKKAFEEAAVDGDFLLDLRAEDLRDVLGVEHELHVRKILLSRDRLAPLTAEAQARLKAVRVEEEAAKRRGGDTILAGGGGGDDDVVDSSETGGVAPDAAIVFSQVRNNRLKRLEQSLKLGFNPETEDEYGNTILLVASQNVNRAACKIILAHGANVNHQNKQGNTALHYAMAYDPKGELGEFLIDSGADDSIANKQDLTPYDGISAD